jgi:hypothetical protein
MTESDPTETLAVALTAYRGQPHQLLARTRTHCGIWDCATDLGKLRLAAG